MKTLIMIGGGHSIKQHLPQLWDDLEGQDIAAVNHSVSQMPYLPKYLISVDEGFWTNIVKTGDFQLLIKKGVTIVAWKIYNVSKVSTIKLYEKTKTIEDSTRLFSGSRNLSGVFALSYICRETDYTDIYLLGYDFGVQQGKTHFYNLKHNGQGRERSYLEKDGSICKAVEEFEYFNQYGKNINIVGESNIKAFTKLSYGEFKEKIR